MSKLSYLIIPLIGIVTIISPSNAVTFKGSLPSPDSVVRETFTVPKVIGNNSSRVRIRSVSYGGGTLLGSPTKPGEAIQKENIDRGGFDIILTLFGSDGSVIDQVDDVSIPGGTGTRRDPNTGVTYDSAFDLELAPGDYELAISNYDNFDFLGRSQELKEEYPGFTDVTGSLRSSQYAVEVLTFKDLIDNTITPPIVDSGLITTAFFQLGKNLELNTQEVAAFGGFDHFNWYQEIVEVNVDTCRDPDLGPDPLPGGNCTDFFTEIIAEIRAFLGDKTAEQYLAAANADNAPWYYNEPLAFDPSVSNINPDFLIEKNTDKLSLNTIAFEDYPAGHDVDTEIIFHTYLAGVEQDPSKGAVFAAPLYENTAFKWKYTQTTEQKADAELLPGEPTIPSTFFGYAPEFLVPELGGTVEFLGFLDESDWRNAAPRLQSQFNVFGLESDNGSNSNNTKVPEPSTLMGLCFTLGLGAKLTKGKK